MAVNEGASGGVASILLQTVAAALAHISIFSLPCNQCPAMPQIGEAVLRKFVFIHLEQPADKLQLLLAMMHKLYAMITRQCSDDNPDALIHHEVLSLRHALFLFPAAFCFGTTFISSWCIPVQPMSSAWSTIVAGAALPWSFRNFAFSPCRLCYLETCSANS